MGGSSSKPEDIEPVVPTNLNKIVNTQVDIAKAVAKNAETIIEIVDIAVPGAGTLKAPIKLAVAILSHAGLGSDDSLDLKKLLEEVRKIIRDELTKEKIAELEASVVATWQWLWVEYIAYSERWSNKKLYKELKTRMDNFYAATIAQLLHKRFCCTRAGLPVFVLAAGIHLIMLHDLAILDPTAAFPLLSAHAEVFGERAQIYGEYIDKAADKVLQERCEKVKFIGQGGQFNGFASHDPAFYWKDKETGQSGPTYKSSRPAEDEYNRRIPIVKKHLHDTLGKPKDVAKHWKRIGPKIMRAIPKSNAHKK